MSEITLVIRRHERRPAELPCRGDVWCFYNLRGDSGHGRILDGFLFPPEQLVHQTQVVFLPHENEEITYLSRANRNSSALRSIRVILRSSLIAYHERENPSLQSMSELWMIVGTHLNNSRTTVIKKALPEAIEKLIEHLPEDERARAEKSLFHTYRLRLQERRKVALSILSRLTFELMHSLSKDPRPLEHFRLTP